LNIGEKKTPAELEAWLDSLDYDDLKGPWTYTGEAFKIANEVTIGILKFFLNTILL
jgi:hypothetical protein